jgi:uncharacterized integral membrane protein
VARIFGTVFAVLLLLLTLAFSVQNAHSVHVDFFVGSYDAPLSFVLLLSVLCGFVAGVLVMLSSLLTVKMENLRLKRDAKLNAKEQSKTEITSARDSKSHG